MGRRHLFLLFVLVAFVAYLTRESWVGCLGLPYTLDIWLHQRKALACTDVSLFYEAPDRVVANCGNRNEASAVRPGESFKACGRTFHADALDRVFPEERYRLTVQVPSR